MNTTKFTLVLAAVAAALSGAASRIGSIRIDTGGGGRPIGATIQDAKAGALHEGTD